jgi:hypothetical protein
MVAMGLDPYATFEDEVKTDILNGAVPDYARSIPDLLVINCLQFLDLPTSRREPIERWYIRMGWKKQLSQAKGIHALILRDNPHTTAEAEKTSEACFRILYPTASH